MAKTAVRGNTAVDALEGHSACGGPNSHLFDPSVRKLIEGEVLALPGGNFWVCLKRDHATGWAHELRRNQGEESDICAEVVKGHAWPQMIAQGFLHLLLAESLPHVLSRSRIHANLKSLARAVEDVHPDKRAG